ncbi:MAG: nucleotidyltransferase family protein [Candidatus Sumerlaeaceae bacterium]
MSPIYEQIERRRQEILALAERHGARHVRVFGSVARGDDNPDSDLDILVDLEPGRGLLDLGGLLMDLRDLLQMQVDVTTPSLLKNRIRARVLAEAVPL